MAEKVSMSPNEVAEALQAAGVPVTRRTVQNWLASGYLQGIRVGGRWRVKSAVLAELLEKWGDTDEPQAGSADHQEVAD